MKVLENVMDKWRQHLKLLIDVLSALISEALKFLEFHRKLCTFVP